MITVLAILPYDVFILFKQKTAYEMRISDWSSDVCSSDLRLHRRHGLAQAPDDAEEMRQHLEETHHRQLADRKAARQAFGGHQLAADPREAHASAGLLLQRRHQPGTELVARRLAGDQEDERPLRSEEHTSELQSLMRISYDVFCLKKQKRI